jgi:hypothetical protein
MGIKPSEGLPRPHSRRRGAVGQLLSLIRWSAVPHEVLDDSGPIGHKAPEQESGAPVVSVQGEQGPRTSVVVPRRLRLAFQRECIGEHPLQIGRTAGGAERVQLRDHGGRASAVKPITSQRRVGGPVAGSRRQGFLEERPNPRRISRPLGPPGRLEVAPVGRHVMGTLGLKE